MILLFVDEGITVCISFMENDSQVWIHSSIVACDSQEKRYDLVLKTKERIKKGLLHIPPIGSLRSPLPPRGGGS